MTEKAGCWFAEVVDAAQLTPHMVRVTFGGETRREYIVEQFPLLLAPPTSEQATSDEATNEELWREYERGIVAGREIERAGEHLLKLGEQPSAKKRRVDSSTVDRLPSGTACGACVRLHRRCSHVPRTFTFL